MSVEKNFNHKLFKKKRERKSLKDDGTHKKKIQQVFEEQIKGETLAFDNLFEKGRMKHPSRRSYSPTLPECKEEDKSRQIFICFFDVTEDAVLKKKNL